MATIGSDNSNKTPELIPAARSRPATTARPNSTGPNTANCEKRNSANLAGLTDSPRPPPATQPTLSIVCDTVVRPFCRYQTILGEMTKAERAKQKRRIAHTRPHRRRQDCAQRRQPQVVKRRILRQKRQPKRRSADQCHQRGPARIARQQRQVAGQRQCQEREHDRVGRNEQASHRDHRQRDIGHRHCQPRPRPEAARRNGPKDHRRYPMKQWRRRRRTQNGMSLPARSVATLITQPISGGLE